MKWIALGVLVQLACFLSYAEEVPEKSVDQTVDTSQTLQKETTDKTDVVKQEDVKKEKRQSQKKKKSDNKISKNAHESMLVGGTKHKHGFPHRKRSKSKTLKPQTICPMMGGPIDKNVYYDYNGMRVYFCCEGCIYSFKRSPRMFLKTLKRYGEWPIKIPKSL